MLYTQVQPRYIVHYVFSRLAQFLNNFQFLSHLQRAVHWSSALTQLHWPLHLFSGLQPHLRSSWHALDAFGRVVHSGSHSWDSDHFQPHLLEEGSSWLTSRHWPQQYPAWYTALFMCWMRAAEVGGMFSSDLPFCVQSVFLAWFKLSTVLVHKPLNGGYCSSHFFIHWTFTQVNNCSHDFVVCHPSRPCCVLSPTRKSRCLITSRNGMEKAKSLTPFWLQRPPYVVYNNVSKTLSTIKSSSRLGWAK